MRIRGKLARLRHRHARDPRLPTFHPAYLLRSPAYKRHGWQDLRAIAKALEQPQPSSYLGAAVGRVSKDEYAGSIQTLLRSS